MKRGRGAVAEDGVGKGEGRRHLALERLRNRAEAVDPAPDRGQAASGDAAIDRVALDPERQQLAAADQSVLLARQPDNHAPMTRTRMPAVFASHNEVNPARITGAPTRAGLSALRTAARPSARPGS